MVQRVRWIEHKGKKIIYHDLSKLNTDEAVRVVRQFEQFVIKNKDNPALVSLTDFTDAHIFGESFEEVKRVAKLVRPILNKRAVIGITGVKKVLYKAANIFANGTPSKMFNTLEEAKDYLVK
ncbi:MAG: hypothetical protein ABFS35_13760 [Bacteroidota bacterium]